MGEILISNKSFILLRWQVSVTWFFASSFVFSYTCLVVCLSSIEPPWFSLFLPLLVLFGSKALFLCGTFLFLVPNVSFRTCCVFIPHLAASLLLNHLYFGIWAKGRNSLTYSLTVFGGDIEDKSHPTLTCFKFHVGISRGSEGLVFVCIPLQRHLLSGSSAAIYRATEWKGRNVAARCTVFAVKGLWVVFVCVLVFHSSPSVYCQAECAREQVSTDKAGCFAYRLPRLKKEKTPSSVVTVMISEHLMSSGCSSWLANIIQ